MVRQLHLRTQGDQESSLAHPDVVGDRFVFNTLTLNVPPAVNLLLLPASLEPHTARDFEFVE